MTQVDPAGMSLTVCVTDPAGSPAAMKRVDVREDAAVDEDRDPALGAGRRPGDRLRHRQEDVDAVHLQRGAAARRRAVDHAGGALVLRDEPAGGLFGGLDVG
jgi:hypothetical protein